jgi:hypothetical protein
MDRNEIIKLARSVWGESAILPFDDLERFAALVAAHEREQCAKVCDPEPDLPNEAYLSHKPRCF